MDFTLCLAITFEMSPVINNCKKSISVLSRRKLHSLNQWESPASLYVEVNAHTSLLDPGRAESGFQAPPNYPAALSSVPFQNGELAEDIILEPENIFNG